jgi:ABC-2 type transport system permease protein
MKRILAILKRDYASFFRSPIGYVVLAIYMFLNGIYYSGDISSSFSDIGTQISSFEWVVFILLIPLITMRIFSEDRKNGTEVLLYTSPASTLNIVLGKYLAALALFLLMTAGTLSHVLITAIFGGILDSSTLGAYIGFIFLGAAYVAIGVFASALTENQIIAAVISFIILIVLTLLDALAGMMGSITSSLLDKINFFGLSAAQVQSAGSAVTSALKWLNPSARLSNYLVGIFELAPLLFFLSIIAAFIFLTNRIIEKRRWSQR